MPAEAVNLFARSGLCLRDGGIVEVETPPRMSGDADGWLVACFHASSNRDVHSDYWEVHPAGQEVVAVLSGSARLILRADGPAGEETVVLEAGSACVVPQNRWHRLEIDGPTGLQSITPRRASRVELVT
jgi:mannose-6-phosphate isomerase-like protein (cupin superfamily)